jgi:predicted kinase
MLVGLPLTGKTTFRKRMFEHFEGLVVSSDDQLMSLAAVHKMTSYNEAYPVLYERANKAALSLARYAAEHMINVVWDQTNLTRKSREKKLGLFPSTYYKIAYVFPTFTHTQLLERQKNVDREGKTIPEDALWNMRVSFDYPSVKEGFNEIRIVGMNGVILSPNTYTVEKGEGKND